MGGQRAYWTTTGSDGDQWGHLVVVFSMSAVEKMRSRGLSGQDSSFFFFMFSLAESSSVTLELTKLISLKYSYFTLPWSFSLIDYYLSHL